MFASLFSRKKTSFSYIGQEIQLKSRTFFHVKTKNRAALETGRNRLIITGCLFLLVFMIIGGRLIEITSFDGNRETHKAYKAGQFELQMERADIIDRKGTVLATSLPTVSLYANPKDIQEPEQAAKKIIKTLPELNYSKILRRLKLNKQFVYLHRNLTPEQQYEINQLGIPSLNFEKGEKRVYPQGTLLSHVVGTTNTDNNGTSGIELFFDEKLKEKGRPLQLSIDIGVQDAARTILLDAMKEFKAIGATCLIMDIHTGELLTLISLPDFDPNKYGQASNNTKFNRATLGVYEMGSIFKLFTAAIAIETGTIKATDSFDATQPLKTASFTIKDYRPQNRWLTVPEILIHSSNIGAAKIGLATGTKTQQKYLGKLGLLERTRIELPEKGTPLTPEKWREVNTATISFGYGVAVTPMQMISATASMANGGLLRPATLLKHNKGSAISETRVFSEKTSNTMRKLMRLVVKEGSGKNADIKGYLVGGKPGSAEKLKHGKYKERTLRTAFAAAFPMDKPRYALFVMMDEPKPTKKTYGYSTSGWNTVPTTGKIIEAIAPLLGIEPRQLPKPKGKPRTILATVQTSGE